MIHTRQSAIHYGFKDINGNEWSNSAVDSYNRYTDEVNRSAGHNIYPGSLTAKERSFMLDQRHRHYVAVMNDLSGDRCPKCFGPVTYYHESNGPTRVVCTAKCNGWAVIKEI